FHYALKPDGFLILGKSESTGEESSLFELFEKDSKIFTKKGELSPGRFNFSFNLNRHDATRGINPGNENMRVSGDTDIEREQELLLLGRYTPPGVLVNKDLHIVRFNGNMSKYLQPASGKASWYLLKMLKDE